MQSIHLSSDVLAATVAANTGGAISDSGTGDAKKPWYRRWWAIGLGVLVVFGIFGAFDDADEETATSEQAASELNGDDAVDPDEAADDADAQSPDDEAVDEQGLAGDGEDPVDEAPSDDETAKPASDFADYEVVAVEDVSGGRYTWRVVVDGQPSGNELRATADAIIADAREDTPYSGLVVFLYDHELLTQDVMTLGRVDDAPGGDWPSAHGAPVGEYDGHDVTYQLYDKHWTLQPTEEEVQLRATWHDRAGELEEEAFAKGENPDFEDLERRAAEDAAARHDTTADEVMDAVSDVLTWQFDGA
jgi:hypothetical protein